MIYLFYIYILAGVGITMWFSKEIYNGDVMDFARVSLEKEEYEDLEETINGMESNKQKEQYKKDLQLQYQTQIIDYKDWTK